MILASQLNATVTVYRRLPASIAPRDSLNNPNYGGYTTGLNVVYTNMPVRFAFTDKRLVFSKEGERLTPNGTMYFGPDYILQEEDRVITTDGIEYVVTSVKTAYLTPNTIDHYEAGVDLP